MIIEAIIFWILVSLIIATIGLELREQYTKVGYCLIMGFILLWFCIGFTIVNDDGYSLISSIVAGMIAMTSAFVITYMEIG